MLQIDNTALSLFRSCKRKYYWRHVLHLVPKATKPWPLLYGGAVHIALEKTNKEEAIDAFTTYYKQFDPPIGEIIEGPRGGLKYSDKRCMVAGVSMLDAYYDYYDDMPYEVVEDEIGFSFLIANKDGDFEEIVYTGRIDKVIQWKTDNRLSVMEHKTSSLTIDKMVYNPHSQVTGYIYALAVRGDYKGLIKDAYIDHILVTLYPRSLKPPKDGGNPASFARLITTRSDWQLDDWRKDIIADCRELQRCEISGSWAKQSGWCNSYMATCEYNNLCIVDKPATLFEEFYERSEWKPWVTQE